MRLVDAAVRFSAKLGEAGAPVIRVSFLGRGFWATGGVGVGVPCPGFVDWDGFSIPSIGIIKI